MAVTAPYTDKPAVGDPLLVDPPKPKPLGLAPPTPTPLPQSPGMAGGLAPLPPITPAGNSPAIPTPTVAPPSTPVDRVKLATDIFNTSAASTQGAYDAASRDNIHNSAALGQLASGGLRTREGNLQLARERDLDTLRKELVNSATEGSIADASTAYSQGLASSQQGQTQQQIDLAKKTADINAALATAGLTGILNGTETLAAKQAAIQNAIEQGRLSIEQGQLALAQLSNTQQNTLQTGQLQLAKDQLAQTGAQFGLSLAQQKDLATLADKTSNRQLDIASAQGHDALLLELARIMGGSTGNVDPNFLAAVAQALGFAMPAGGVPPVTNPTAPTTPAPYLPPGSTPGVGGSKNGDNGGGILGLAQ